MSKAGGERGSILHKLMEEVLTGETAGRYGTVACAGR